MGLPGSAEAPGPLTLKPPPSLRIAAMLLAVGAALLCLAQPDRFGGIGAAGMVLAAMQLLLRYRSMRGQQLGLFEGREWVPPNASDRFRLTGGSARMVGMFWLHGVDDAGRRRHVFLTPDMFESAEAYRCLCVWYQRQDGGSL